MNKNLENLKTINEKEELTTCFSFSENEHFLLVGPYLDTAKMMRKIALDFTRKYDPSNLKILIISNTSEFSDFKDLDKSRLNTCKLLDDLCSSMENRYIEFMNMKARSIDEYNEVSIKKLPYCLVFIHNLNELLLAYKKIRTPLIKLLQKSRAAGFRFIVSSEEETLKVLKSEILDCLNRIFKVD